MRKILTIAFTLTISMVHAQVGELIWEDNFNNLDNWNQEIGNGSWGWGNGELEYYRGENVEIAETPGEPGNNSLRITAREESGPGIADQWGNPLNYTSGKVTTRAKIAVQYGMIEARVNIPDINLGGWPAIWLLGDANYAWPNNGELDLMEMGSRQEFRDAHDTHNGGNGLNNSTVNQVVGANAIFYSEDALTPENPSGAASISWDPDDDYVRMYYNHDNPLIERFLIYRMYWDDASIRFTVIDEDVEYDLYTDPFPIDSVSSEFQQPFYLIANLAIGGAFTDAYNLGDPGSGAPVSMTLPAEMYLDYIRIFEWNGQGHVRIGPPYPESGTFGIFTDETPTNGGLQAGVSAEIYVWEGTLVDGTIASYEGENGISWQTTGAGWFGAGIMSVQPLNLTNFNDGSLKFRIKIPANVTFKIGVIDTWNNQNFITFPANETTYDLTRDGEWGQASVPMVDLRGTAIDTRMLSYAFVILEESGAACEFALDDIYYEGGGVANPPIAHAGSDQIIEDGDGDGLESVTLDGSASIDRMGSIESFEWTAADTVISTGEMPAVLLPLGEHNITLTVTDNDELTDSDMVRIIVLNNYLPTADAGSDQTVIDTNGDGLEIIELDGSGSSDPDGTIATYTWSENGIELATGVQATVNLDVGAHLITLEVTDTDGGTDTDALAVRVNSNLPVQAPAIYHTNSAISIDETIEMAWFGTPEMGINNVTVGSRTSDFAAQWKGLWDDTNLYLLVEINDEALFRDSGAGWYMDDGIEVFIDGDNSSGGSYDGVNDFQFGFTWSDADIKIGNNSINDVTGINFALYATEVGYNLEASFPWNTIGVNPHSLSHIGFDVAVDDDDNGGDRECAVASIFTTDNAWYNPSVFGNVPMVTTTGIEENSTQTPSNFSLSQNDPNPFNPSTTIHYRLANDSQIELLVFDLRGRLVKTLKNDFQVAGRYEMQWNGIDQAGNPVSTGVYFCRLHTAQHSSTIKMLYLN